MMTSAIEENKAKKGEGVTASNKGFKKGPTKRVTLEQRLKDTKAIQLAGENYYE